jgi:hypothetical protein
MNLLRDLSHVNVEVLDRITEQFTDRHKIMKIGIPPAGIVYPAFPFVVPNSLKLSHKREMDPVIHSTNPLMREYSSLQPGPKGVNPVERRGEVFSVEAKILEVHRGK